MEINGVAHTFLTVSDFQACRPFYAKLLPFLGLVPVIDTDGMLYCIGGRTAVGVVQGEDAFRSERFTQLRVGLHHLCFRARERSDVLIAHANRKGIDADARKKCKSQLGPDP